MRRVNERAVAVCVLLAAGATAAAQDLNGPYVGGALGILDHEESNGLTLDANADTETYRIFGGYRIARHVAVEGSWAEAPDLRVSARGDFPAFPDAEAEIDYRILAIKGVALWPIGRFGFFHGLGYYDSDADVSVSRNGIELVAVEEAEQGFLLFGGVFYDLDRLSLRAEYQWHENLNGADVTDVSAGAWFRF